jgi:hypothetical protein
MSTSPVKIWPAGGKSFTSNINSFHKNLMPMGKSLMNHWLTLVKLFEELRLWDIRARIE